MRKFNKVTALTFAGLLVSTAGALAAPGIATSAVNVRTGPSTSYNKVDALYSGEHVEIVECQSGWCYVDHEGQDGWVSASYLAPLDGSSGDSAGSGSGDGSGTSSSDPECHFNWVVGEGFTMECGGNSVTIPGPGSSSPPPPPPPVEPRVCFYDQINYGGASSCVPAGTVDNNVTGFWNDRVSSIKLFGGAKVRLFVDHNYCGNRNVFTNDVPHLGAMLNNKASSYQTWTDAPPLVPLCALPPVVVVPHTMSTGPITLQAGHWANLENGAVGPVVPFTPPAADFFFDHPSPFGNVLKPIHGARFALGDRSNRGYAGCAAETFSTNFIPLTAMPVGSYVCVKTNEGHISQFRVNAVHPMSVNLGYTTFSN